MNRLREPHRVFLHPAFLVGIAITLSFSIWWPRNFVGFIHYAIGETYEAYHGAVNVARFGWKWAGLQDMATNPSAEAHPFFYIHHGNLGIYLSYLLSKLGFTSIETQNLISGIGFFAGLSVAYLFVTRCLDSKIAGVAFLLFACLDLWSSSNWTFNLLRAFGYLAVFGTLLAYSSWLQRRTWQSLVLLASGTVVLLYSDYMFFIFTFIVVLLYQFRFQSGWSISNAARTTFVICSVFFGAFFLRQLQVLAGIGADIWARDFLYQVLNRMHLEFLYRGDWSRETMAFYEKSHVLNPGFAPYVTLGERIESFVRDTGISFCTYILNWPNASPHAGTVVGVFLYIALLATLVCSAPIPTTQNGRIHIWQRRAGLFVSAGCLIVIAGALALNGLTAAHASFSMVYFALTIVVSGAAGFYLLRQVIFQMGIVRKADVVTSLPPALGFSLILLLACVAMYALFPRYFFQWFPAYQLVGMCLVMWTITIVTPFLESPRPSGYAYGVLIAFLVLKLVAITPRLTNIPDDPGDYASALRKLEGRTVISNFTPATVATYTRAFSAAIRADSVSKLAKQQPLELTDYHLFGERDRDNGSYLRPEFFIFFFSAGSRATADELAAKGLPVVAKGKSFVLFRLRDTAIR